ncbi:MAG: glycoside hydrolase family 31 protein, partial [Deltaproteobacteria bacterium]|nr:glycoside hydrolase family 31 protein [Deltaproteobacteria bacterium]
LQAGPLQPARGEVAFTRMRFDSPRTEAYYGLGEHFAQVQRRGTVQAMQFEVTELESVNNEAHVPIPFFTGNRGWGLFVEERRPGTFDMACLDQSAVSATFAADRLRAHLLADADPLQVVAAYTLLTGAPALPAIWAFAPMQWRNEHRDAAQVLEDARAMRQHRIPGSTIWIDNPWQTAYNTHLFDPERFPDPAGMIRELHGLGYRVVVWSTPYLQEEAGDAYQEAVEQGYFVDYTAFFTKFGKLVDLTNPGAVDLWKRLIGRVTSLGVEGFKLDYGEDVQIGTGQLRLRHLFHNGEDERTMHHGYQLFYHRPYAESLPAEGGFVLSRSGTYGDQALSTTIWPGDLDNDFRRYGEERHVGGLPSAIIGGLTLSASGFPLYASDIGGFRHGRPTAEVLLRWAAYASLLPIMQLGGGGTNHNPWDFAAHGDEPRYDEETLRVYRRFAQLHMELFPYAYTLAEQARRTGMPVTRPFGLVYPQDGRHPDFVFLVGEDLLAAPSPDGRAEVEVPLPQGRWLDWFSGEVASGRGSVVRAVPLDEVPLYLAEGGIVPLLRPGVDTLATAVVAGVDSWAARPGPLGARLFPGPRPRERTVFDGARIAAHRDEAAGEVAIGLVAGQRFSGWQLAVEWRAAWGTEQPPARVLRDGSPLARAGSAQEAGECASCWFHEVASGRVRITATAGDHRLVLSR